MNEKNEEKHDEVGYKLFRKMVYCETMFKIGVISICIILGCFGLFISIAIINNIDFDLYFLIVILFFILFIVALYFPILRYLRLIFIKKLKKYESEKNKNE